MKKIYFLFLGTVIGLNVNAQLTLTKTNNEPVVGNIVNNAEYDSTTAVPKATGAGQNWNFQSLTSASFTEVITYTTVANPAFQSIANIDKLRNGGNPETYNNTASNLSMVGFYDNSGPSLTSFASNTGVWLNWPTAFGNSNTDTFSGTETSTTYTNTWSGTLSYTASGSGTVTLPDGTKHNNCLQLKKVINVVITGASPTVSMTITNYEYWSSSQRHPIINTEYQTMKSGTVTQMGFNAFVNAAALTGVQQQPLIVKEPRIYPNPAIDKVMIDLPNNEVAEQIELFDVKGSLVLTAKNTNSIKTASLNRGLYFVKVKTKDSTLEQRMVITE
jgi:hypothetical protein